MTNDDILFSPDIYIMPGAKEKLDLYVELADGEISGFGTVMENDGNILIDDVFIFEQESSHASTEMESETLSKFITDLIAEGKEEMLPRIRLWWHSHANMSPFWSGTDKDTSREFVNAPWFISLVANKKNEYRVRFDMFKQGGSPFDIGLDDLTLYMWETPNTELREQIKAEIEEKVSSSSSSVVTAYSSYGWSKSPGSYMEQVYCKGAGCFNKISKSKESGFCYHCEPLIDDEEYCSVINCGNKVNKKYYLEGLCWKHNGKLYSATSIEVDKVDDKVEDSYFDGEHVWEVDSAGNVINRIPLEDLTEEELNRVGDYYSIGESGFD